MPDRRPPPGHDPRAVAQLRTSLRAARFDAAHVADALGAEGPNLTPSPAQVPGLLRSLPAGDRLATLIRLFVAAVPVRVDEAAAALAPLPLDAAAGLDLVTVAEDTQLVHAAIRLVPAGPVLVAFDITPDPSKVPPDVVMGVSSTSWTLAHLTIRRPVESAVDIGTGCGIQALLAARHAARVTATDTNSRALGFARFSAALNQLDNIEFLPGDLFEPVAGRRFDLILANPPFVISPDAAYQYRDGGQLRDDLSRRVVEGAAALLTPGGFAHMLVSWVHEPDGDWSHPPRRWADGLGCDAWLFHFDSKDAEDYAVDWNQPLHGDPDEHAAAIGRWLDYFHDHGIEAIGYGGVVLRRRPAGSGDPWIRGRSVGTIPVAPAGDQVAALFAAGDYLERVENIHRLLDGRFVVDDALRVEQVLRLRNGAFEVEQALLHLERGLPMAAEVDAYAAHLMARLHREGTLAGEFDEDDGATAAELRRVAADLLGGLLELGFVHPA